MATTSAPTNTSANNTSATSASPVTEKATEALHKTIDSLGERAATSEEKLRATMANSAESIHHQQQMIQGKWQTSKVRGYAVENPLTTAGIAFAAGVLLANLMRKS